MMFYFAPRDIAVLSVPESYIMPKADLRSNQRVEDALSGLSGLLWCLAHDDILAFVRPSILFIASAPCLANLLSISKEFG